MMIGLLVLILALWAAVDIYRMWRYSRWLNEYYGNYDKARVALMCGDYQSEAFRWAQKQADVPERVFHHTWPLHRFTI